jgi:hypothetical protein
VAEPASPARAPALADGAVGFLSSATDHVPVRQQDGRLWTPDGPAEFAGVYSARLFDEHADLRWLHTARSLGTAVVVTEEPARYPTWTTELLPTVSGRLRLGRGEPLGFGSVELTATATTVRKAPRSPAESARWAPAPTPLT